MTSGFGSGTAGSIVVLRVMSSLRARMKASFDFDLSHTTAITVVLYPKLHSSFLSLLILKHSLLFSVSFYLIILSLEVTAQ